jgi:SagB-type dehydrogenase family enzyme
MSGFDEDSSLWMTFHHNSRLSFYRPPLADRAVADVMRALHPVLSYEEAEAHRSVNASQIQRTLMGKALTGRRTTDAFGPEPMDAENLDCILTGAYGIIAPRGNAPPHRTVPSAGALYPAELYVLVRNVRDVAKGIWHYNPIESRMELIDSRAAAITEVNTAFVQAAIVERSAIIVLITMAFERQTFKYGPRGYRFALVEAGHIAQNLILIAAELELAALPIGGLYEHVVDQALGIDGLSHGTVYAVAVGARP